MPMQPSPIAETSGPSRPKRLFCTISVLLPIRPQRPRVTIDASARRASDALGRTCERDNDSLPFRRPLRHGGAMLYLAIKAGLSGIIVALVSEVARRWPGWGGMIASLPLVSVLAMVWLWRDTQDPA